MRIFLLFFLSLTTSISLANQLDYSGIDPQIIQKDLSTCPQTAPKHFPLSCAELRLEAEKINDLAVQLQMDRQGFGKTILELQQKVAEQQEQINTSGNDNNLALEIANNRHEIKQRLAIIKWLDSPR